MITLLVDKQTLSMWKCYDAETCLLNAAIQSVQQVCNPSVDVSPVP